MRFLRRHRKPDDGIVRAEAAWESAVKSLNETKSRDSRVNESLANLRNIREKAHIPRSLQAIVMYYGRTQ